MGQILTMLEQTQGRVPLHMPGHMGRPPLGTTLDTTELISTDDLFDPKPGGPYELAQKALAQALGAAQARFLTGGSTQGIWAMVLALRMAITQRERGARPPRLWIARGCHKSVFHACALCGVNPDYLYPEADRDNAFCFLSADRILAQVDAAAQKPDAVLITAPDYYGAMADTAFLSQQLHARGVLLLADAAHGAHLPFIGRPVHADLAVYSAHKTLPALTMCAMLAISDPSLAPFVQRALARISTTSPSSLLCLSIDEARIWMQREGTARYAALKSAIDAFWRDCPYPNAHGYMTRQGIDCDPTRVVIDMRPSGRTGFEWLALLADRGIDLEMADEARLVAITTVMTQARDLQALCGALRSVPPKTPLPAPELLLPGDADRVIPLPQAMNAPVRAVPLAQAAGCVSAVCAGAYPPGIPLVAPGERITPGCAAALAACANPFGLRDGAIEVVLPPQDNPANA